MDVAIAGKVDDRIEAANVRERHRRDEVMGDMKRGARRSGCPAGAGDNLVAGVGQGRYDMAAEEAGGAGHENTHQPLALA